MSLILLHPVCSITSSAILWYAKYKAVTKFEIPKLEDLRFTTFSSDLTYKHLNTSNHYMQRCIKHCKGIAPCVKFYKKKIGYYNCTAYEILQNKLGLVLPIFTNNKRQKRGIITTILGSIASYVIGLAYERISSFFHHKRLKSPHKAVKVIEKRTDMQHNRVYHLEDTMVMYGTYNSDTLTDLIETVYNMHNVTTLKERIFAGTMHKWFKEQLINWNNEYSYATDSILFLTTIKEKYVRVYEKFIVELKSYSKAIRILSKGYLPISLMPPSKLEAILKQVKLVLGKTNKDYDLALTRLYLYYDMKLVMFCIDSQRNLIIQFPVFVQPYTETRLILYQIETVWFQF